jgi:hypothetical protein
MSVVVLLPTSIATYWRRCQLWHFVVDISCGVCCQSQYLLYCIHTGQWDNLLRGFLFTCHWRLQCEQLVCLVGPPKQPRREEDCRPGPLRSPPRVRLRSQTKNYIRAIPRAAGVSPASQDRMEHSGHNSRINNNSDIFHCDQIMFCAGKEEGYLWLEHI